MSPSLPLRPEQLAGVSLSHLASLVGATAPHRDQLITGITLRAHEARPGDLFCALQGARVHGASFADEAVRRGAVAVITDCMGRALAGSVVPVVTMPDPRPAVGMLAAELFGNPSEHLQIFGVTGTSGKTTTCYLIEAALTALGLNTGLIGTVQTRVGGQVWPSAFTTPEAPDLQALFAVMLERGTQAVAMEVSSHALSLGRVGGTRFAVGAFTNLSQDHLDFHTDMDDYFNAKALLFDGRAKAGVIDIDDPYGARLAAAHPDAATVSASGNPQADWTAPQVLALPGGLRRLSVRGPEGLALDVDLALPGSFNIANALTALASVHGAGLDVVAAAGGLASVAVPGRMQRVDAGQDFLALVDYAHKPAALAAVLGAVRVGLTGRVIAVIGAGGDRDRAKRPIMGAEAAARAELVIITDDNPRSEDPAEIRAEVLAGARSVAGAHAADSAEILEVADRRDAIRAAVAAARPGDAVVIAGKGHEQGQYVGESVLPFSDADELREALEAKLGEVRS